MKTPNGTNPLMFWITQKWAGYWATKYFWTNKYIYWIIACAPFCDGYNSNKVYWNKTEK
jgi:hypothetical protein